MAEYKAIRGHTIQTVAGDPGTIADGLIWYDSVAKKVQGSKTAAGAWATNGDINQGRYSGGSATEAPGTAGLIFGGDSPEYNNTETYDGSSWTEVNNLNTGRGNFAGAGTQTAALASGGSASPQGQSEEFDGTNWAEGDDLNTARAGLTGNGPQTASLSTGGKIGENFQTLNELYNGSSWSEAGDLNTARAYHSTTGDSTAGLAAGGSSPYTVDSEEFNGTSWTEGSNLNVAKAYIRSGFGTQTASLVCGGYSPSGTFATTEQYDGTSWTEVGDLPTATRDHFGSGSSTAGLANGGRSAPGSTLTEGYEWLHAASAVTFTSS